MIKKLKPLFILLGAFALSYLLWFLGQVQPDPVEELPPPDVIIEILTPKDFQVQISSNGTTTPLTQTVLTAEVGGEVIYRSKKCAEGASVIEDEILEETSDNYKLLADSWYQAYELRSALQSYEKASKLSDSGEIQFRIASIYLDLGEDKNAYRASLLAEKKGAGKHKAANYNKMGMALTNMYCFKDAVKAFNNAVKHSKDRKSQRSPKQWIKYASFEDDRYRKLRNAGAKVKSCGKA